MNSINGSNGDIRPPITVAAEHNDCNGEIETVDNTININQEYDNNSLLQENSVVSIQISDDEINQSPIRRYRRHRLDSESIEIEGNSDEDDDDETGDGRETDRTRMVTNVEDDNNQLGIVPTYQADDNLEVATYFCCLA